MKNRMTAHFITKHSKLNLGTFERARAVGVGVRECVEWRQGLEKGIYVVEGKD